MMQPKRRQFYPNIVIIVYNCSSKRQRRVKLVGRRITHEWKEDDGPAKWYKGTVLSVKGRDGDTRAVYQVQYDEEDEPYHVDNLASDYDEGILKFIDL